jgi:hypothetical protein
VGPKQLNKNDAEERYLKGIYYYVDCDSYCGFIPTFFITKALSDSKLA